MLILDASEEVLLSGELNSFFTGECFSAATLLVEKNRLSVKILTNQIPEIGFCFARSRTNITSDIYTG